MLGFAVAGLALTAIGSYRDKRNERKHAKETSKINQKEIQHKQEQVMRNIENLHDRKVGYRDQQDMLLKQIEHIFGSGQTQLDRLDNQTDSILDRQQALNLDRAQIALEGLGIGHNQALLEQRESLYGHMMQHTRDTTDAIKSETMQRLNLNLEQMELRKTQVQDESNMKMAVREIQTLRDRSNIMVATGEAGVGGSSVGRMVAQAVSDATMEKSQVQQKATSLLQELSIDAQGAMMGAQSQVAQAERQALGQKLQTLSALNQLETQMVNLKLQESGLGLKEQRVDLQDREYSSQIKDLELQREQTARDTAMSAEDKRHNIKQLEHQINEVKHQQGQLAHEIEGMDYAKIRDELNLERVTGGNILVDTFFETAPTAVALWLDYGGDM